MLPTFVKMVKNAPHPFQFVQFSLRVRNSRPRPDMVQGIADQLHSSERDTKRGDKACSAIPVGETADVVHIGIDLVGLMRQHERCPTLLCPRFSAIPPSFLVVSVGVNNERNASRNSLVQMVSSIEVGHDTEDIHSVKAAPTAPSAAINTVFAGQVFARSSSSTAAPTSTTFSAFMSR